MPAATSSLLTVTTAPRFFVTAGPVELHRISGSALARACRYPDVISGTAFVFDKYQNLVHAAAARKV